MTTVIVSPGVAPVYATFVLKSLPIVRVAALSGWSGNVTVGFASSAVPCTSVAYDVDLPFERICTTTPSPSLSWPTVVLRSSGLKVVVMGVSGAIVKT
jgi:hypothetical protein